MTLRRPAIVLPEREVSRQCRAVFRAFAWAIDIRRNNVCQFTDKYGHKVRSGAVGEPDFLGQFRDYGGRWAGRTLGVEIKRGDFDPTRIPRTIGSLKSLKHWFDQMSYMNKINQNGGVALWVRDAGELGVALRKILDGAGATLDEQGWPFLET